MEINSPQYYSRPPDYPTEGGKKSHVKTARWLNEGQDPPSSDEIGITVDTTDPSLKRIRLEKGMNDPSWKKPSESLLTEAGVNHLVKLLGDRVFQELAIGDVTTLTPLIDALKTCEGIAVLDLRCLTVMKQVGGKWHIVAPRPAHIEAISEIIANPKIDRIFLSTNLIDRSHLSTLATILETHPNAAKISVVEDDHGIERAWDSAASMLENKQETQESSAGQVCCHLNAGNAQGAMDVLEMALRSITGQQTLDLTSRFLRLSDKGVDTLLEVLLSETTNLDIVELGVTSDFTPILRALPKLRLSTLDLGKATASYKNMPCPFRPEDVDTLIEVQANHTTWKPSLVIDSRWLPLEKTAELSELLKKTGMKINDNYTPFIRYSPL